MLLKSLTINEMLELTNKIWANTKDIMLIGMIGKLKAEEIKKNIRWYEKKVYSVPRGYVLMEKIASHFNINIINLKKISENKH